MPELPEVETVRRGLFRLIVGNVVASATCLDSPKSFPNAPSDVQAFLVGARIVDVRRRAKLLLIELSSGYTLMTHLKMTGQLVYIAQGPAEVRFGAGHPNDSLVGELPDRSTRVVIEFTDGSHLYFNDQRKFGWMRIYPTAQVPEIDFMKKVGPEPLEDSFTSAQFAQRFARRKNTSIKAALLDQTVLAGVGNIYADESLWGAMIDPRRKVVDISAVEFTTLYTELRYVLNLAIEKGGSTNKNYVNAEGKIGSYMDFARVFRRDKLACPRCGSVIQKIQHAGRGTHFCATCQK
ncbi:bifunctional DNA-formamidopyrimidine glycosylase/DNA-(apurinic or apyrimidinic site) lyase [Candidatus Saccharibacteria bacterium]|nr:bifunctional DNA-formamidopyrimidine glycosylase/DNA-(apurinic or apyrimidinic site) lyase [Candidatus Saccharibacteria bacterium]